MVIRVAATGALFAACAAAWGRPGLGVAALTTPAIWLARRPTRPAARPKLRRIMGPAWLHHCAYCGRRAAGWDHLIPRSRGGPDTPDNLVPACTACNSSKGDRPLHEWIAGP